MATYYLWNIGCQMNKAESERMSDYLEGLGYRPVSQPHGADVVVLNTCVVRGNAEDRVLGELSYLKGLKSRSPEMGIAVTGCFVGGTSEDMKGRFPQVDIFFPAGEFSPFREWVAARVGDAGTGSIPDSAPERPAPTAFVPIIRGCNNFCSYCIVPYRRGRERSRSLDEITNEAQGLVRRGVKEVTLLGQNVNSYGRDLPDKPDLADLLVRLNSVSGLERIRFLTSHPRDVNRKFIEAMAGLERVCESINLPVQAGDDRVLQAMRRGYTVEQYRGLVAELRSCVPGIAVSTDVIVGFPGETEEEFGHTVDLLSDLKFDTVHVAAYSPRPGTLAYSAMCDDVPALEKERRLRAVEEMQERIAAEKNQALLGRYVELLVERENKGKWEGRTRGNRLVFFTYVADWKGRLCNVEILAASAWSLQGRLVSRIEVGVR